MPTGIPTQKVLFTSTSIYITRIFGPLLGTEDNSGVNSTPNVTTCLNMLDSTGLGGGLFSIAYYPTNISPSTNNNGIAVVLNFATPTNGAEFGIAVQVIYTPA